MKFKITDNNGNISPDYFILDDIDLSKTIHLSGVGPSGQSNNNLVHIPTESFIATTSSKNLSFLKNILTNLEKIKKVTINKPHNYYEFNGLIVRQIKHGVQHINSKVTNIEVEFVFDYMVIEDIKSIRKEKLEKLKWKQ